MEPQPVLTIDNVSKYFKIYHHAVLGPALECIFPWKKDIFYKRFEALHEVSFSIKEGEVVGIIGPNGAGKTTLLKLIAGLSNVTKGAITVKGRITALLALGIGFHEEFTGRENIFYGGLLLGMSKKELDRKIEKIIEFSELADYIDWPLRTYSSGMRARLAFSTAMSVEPDILIIDEALAAGDAHFVGKCLKKIKEICKSGVTTIFVSHDLRSVKNLCNRVIVLGNGKKIFDGEPGLAIDAYSEFTRKHESMKHDVVSSGKNDTFIDATGSYGIKLLDVQVRNFNKNNVIMSGEPIEIDITYKNNTPDEKKVINMFVGFLEYESQTYVGDLSTADLVSPKREAGVSSEGLLLKREGRIKISIEKLLLINNHYSLWIIFYAKDSWEYYGDYKNICPFFVSRVSQPFTRDAYFTHPATIAIE